MIPSVTGWAWRTPLGADVNLACDRLLAGERAAVPNPFSDGYAPTRVAPIPDAPAPSRNRRFVSTIALHAIETAAEAADMAEIGASDRFGVYAAIGGLRAGWDQLMPAMQQQRPDASGSWERGFRALHPLWMLRYLSNNAHGIIAAELGARGEGVTFGGPIAGAQAIGAAHRALALGTVDHALVVAYDTLLAPELLVELEATEVPGGAAAALVLERSDTRALALVRASCAHDASPGQPDPSTIARAARPLIEPELVVDGPAVPGFDAAIGTTIVSATGRVGAATSLVQVIALASCLRRGTVPTARGALPIDRSAALCVSTGAPGAAAAVHVEVSV